MKKYFLPALLAVSLLGCKADLVVCTPDGGGTVTPPPATLTAFATQYGAISQQFSLTPGSGQTVTTAKGNRFAFTPSNFVRSDNRPLSTSPIKMAVREIMGKGDMVLSAMPTVDTNGQLLESAGEFQLLATQDNVPLRINDTTRVTFSTVPPAMLNSAQGMQLFVGGGSGTACFGWVPVPSSTLSSNGQQGFAGSVPGTLLNSGEGWINCDRFATIQTATPLAVTVAGSNVTIDNTGVFIVFEDLNAVMKVCGVNGSSTFTAARVPVGARVKVLTLRTDNGRLYYGKQSLTIAQNQTLTLTPTEANEADIVADIRGL
ncbi:hypothetical protein [Hymenobacter sp. CRA2]|uniref:hypothetical protein n=1 Tax=Hymenobacter sp. CRA2 TaxID=1955620 RepID=UPI00098F5203|nr:hypothetical protein [Hymenobacter sp. CRA2]OON67100.1 hypothetical protein B0919_19930 [Hymenobacter sp. CRA2]